jgi:hypothetical protein
MKSPSYAIADVVLLNCGGVETSEVLVDEKLLASLPAANRVLEIGRTDSSIGDLYIKKYTSAEWLRVNSEVAALEAVRGTFDLLVLSNGLPPPQLLELATSKVLTGGSLFATLKNAASWSALTDLIEGDIDATDAPLSPAAAYKHLLDAGWMPTIADQHPAMLPKTDLSACAARFADTLGVPRRTADRTLGMARIIIQAVRRFDDQPRRPGRALFSVVVPTTRVTQLRANVERSPGLKEVRAQIISYRGARSAAEALSKSIPHCDSEWVLFCHQDVYFPKGFGEQLNAVLAGVADEVKQSALFGFVGMAINRSTLLCEPAGFVIDRLHRGDYLQSDSALSIDELAIVVARDTIYSLDPMFGWHLWATDLCLTAVQSNRLLPCIIRLPVFHNSSNDYVLPESFYGAANLLKCKYPDFGPIHTLCGVIK